MALLLTTSFEAEALGLWGAANLLPGAPTSIPSGGASPALGDPGNRYWRPNASGAIDGTLLDLSIVNTFAREGTKCLRHAVNGNGTVNVYRSEVTAGAKGQVSEDGVGINRTMISGTERWYGCSYLNPSSNFWGPAAGTPAENSPQQAIIFQLHVLDGGPLTGPSPAISIEIDEFGYWINKMYSRQPNPSAEDISLVRSRFWLCPLIFDEWVDIVLHFKLEAVAPGILEVWMGTGGVMRKVFENFESNCYFRTDTDAAGGGAYIKSGLYFGDWRSANAVPPAGHPAATKVLYQGVIRIGDAASSLAEVKPQGDPVNPPKTNRLIP